MAADVGGTFTDLVSIESDGSVRRAKVLSTPPHFEKGVIEGLGGLTGGGVAGIGNLIHATTTATNAILERSGPRTGLIATEGFRDVLEIGRLRYPRLYDLAWVKPAPLVPRERRLAVPERIAADGSVVRPLDPDAVQAAARKLRDQGVEALAVCLLNSYANDRHERAVGEVLARELPGVPISLSVDVLPVIREFDRASTTVVNAYLRPVIGSYLGRLEQGLAARGSRAPVLMLQSAGGVMPASDAARLPAFGVESGPSAGVMAAAALARDLGLERVISFDMGGTTAKAGMVLHGRPAMADEFEVGAGISSGSRLSRGGGYLLRTPSLDLAEVGAGGGSIAAVDRAGGVSVGPRSAGADPGPACYGLGGAAATLTDANLVLGFLSADGLLNGGMRLSTEAARRVIGEQLAQPLGLSVERAADAAHRVAVAIMARAIRAVTSERGHDPRKFTLAAFGGAGPGHAAALAGHLGIRRVLVPAFPGVFSAIGLARADLRWTAAKSQMIALDDGAAALLRDGFGELERRALGMAAAAGYRDSELQIERIAACRYRGQSFELPVGVAAGRMGRKLVGEVREAFEAAHHDAYGHREPNARVQAVTLRVDVVHAVHSPAPRGTADGRAGDVRPVWSGSRMERTPVLGRAGVRRWTAGPLVIEDYDATTLVPSGWRAHTDSDGHLHLERLR